MLRSMTGRPDGARHPPGRASVQVVAVLAWALTVSQSLVVVHGYTHPTTRAAAGCGICLVGARVAQVSDAPPAPLEPRALCLPLAAVAHAPYASAFHQTGDARAPPLLASKSAAV